MRIDTFGDKTTHEMAAAMQKLQAGNLRGLVLDLRNDPVGRLDASVDVCRMFINSGVIVTKRPCETVFDLTPEEAAAVHALLHEVLVALTLPRVVRRLLLRVHAREARAVRELHERRGLRHDTGLIVVARNPRVPIDSVTTYPAVRYKAIVAKLRLIIPVASRSHSRSALFK